MRTKFGIMRVTVAVLWACGVRAAEYTGPAEWRMVNTNGVRAWQAAQQAAASGGTVAVWPGVAADPVRREVRLLAEAVGHTEGVTTEFILIGPMSDRAYEAVAVTVAAPSDIVRAVEHLGLKRGGGVGSRPFRFWPVGERVTATVRRLDGTDAAVLPLQTLIRDEGEGEPLVGEGGLVFTGGRWVGPSCLTDTNMPCSVISLYNAGETVFDVPFRVGQSEVYGRLKLARSYPCGALIEVVLRPLAADGRPQVLSLRVTAEPGEGGVSLVTRGADGTVLHRSALAEGLVWLRKQADTGRELFVTLEMDETLTLQQATEVARIFDMLDGKGLKLDGKGEDGVYAKAFLPLERWREREGRTPQPFELHVKRNAEGGWTRSLVFIEEDWQVEGLDPRLTPRTYPFEEWEALPGLTARAGGAENKVRVLFVFAPREASLRTFMPGVRALSGRLPIVYVFGE
ncbi:MAG TPA: hypothetical protein PK576_03745 [Kiritimatiellia bacterium]|nr:hypothetical protein [Kiritimatiellia bacterium]